MVTTEYKTDRCPHRVAAMATKLMKRPVVLNAIREATAARIQRLQLTADEVVYELSNIGRAMAALPGVFPSTVINVAKLGINYHFSANLGPVTAKY